MQCAISGEAPQEPVVSKKSGAIFEKRLIEKYIEEHGTEPGTGEELDVEDLLPLKSSAPIVHPRTPAQTSIPAMLSAFQNEWDSFVLQQYKLNEQLAETREQLTTALYQHDAAVRVIARLTKERDEARQALSQVSATPGVDPKLKDDERLPQSPLPESLPESFVQQVTEYQRAMSHSRKKRTVEPGWATVEEVSHYRELSIGRVDYLPTSLLVNDDYATIGTTEGDVSVYAFDEGVQEQVIQITNHAITGVIRTDAKLIVSTDNGSVHVYQNGMKQAAVKAHIGPITGLAFQPAEDMFATVGVDKSFVFYSMLTGEKLRRVYTFYPLTTCAFHPDGNLFATGNTNGDIQIFDAVSGQEAATYNMKAPIRAIAFSENGYTFAASAKGQPTVQIFDLRKEGKAAYVKELATGKAYSLEFDHSAQFLATAGPAGLTVQHYNKSSKKWSEIYRNDLPALVVKWSSKAKMLVTASANGNVTVIGSLDKEDEMAD